MAFFSGRGWTEDTRLWSGLSSPITKAQHCKRENEEQLLVCVLCWIHGAHTLLCVDHTAFLFWQVLFACSLVPSSLLFLFSSPSPLSSLFLSSQQQFKTLRRMWGLLTGGGLVAQAMALTWSQQYPSFHDYVMLPTALCTFTAGIVFLTEAFVLTPLFVRF